MTDIYDKIATIGPEITLLVGACLCMALGLAKSAAVRKLSAAVAALALIAAARFALDAETTAPLARYIQLAVAGVGLLLLMVAVAVPDEFAAAGPRSVDPTKRRDAADRGEFFGFLLLSLAGAMLCAGAGDLVWLFLALELTSLPTYVIIATSRRQLAAKESAVKYFFLGAMSAAVFLYGFTLIYGAAGSTRFDEIQAMIVRTGVSPLMTLGLVLAILGIAFKIAAVPMHFYAADVYQGATTPITAFLAFVPKTAGFVAIILLLRLVGWPLPPALMWLLWIMAAATMTIGNTLGLLQSNVKRLLAYSSIAHSGYMLVGLIGNDATAVGPNFALGNGVAAVLFYLPAYGLATLGVFAVLACIDSRGEEAETFGDLAGLSKRSPVLAAVMLVCILSLIGLPPLVGLVGKVYLFASAIKHGFMALVIIAVLNSAISAVYYLRILSACFFAEPDEHIELADTPLRRTAACVAALLTLILFFRAAPLVNAAADAAADAATIAPAKARTVSQPAPAAPPATLGQVSSRSAAQPSTPGAAH